MSEQIVRGEGERTKGAAAATAVAAVELQAQLSVCRFVASVGCQFSRSVSQSVSQSVGCLSLALSVRRSRGLCHASSSVLLLVVVVVVVSADEITAASLDE